MHSVNGDSSAPRAPRLGSPSQVDARPALISSGRRGTPTLAMGGRDVPPGNPSPRRHRVRLSGATLIGIALAGSVGAVTAVNATLFPTLGHPTAESVWQNPGKVPASATSSDPTTPRAVRVVVIDPTTAPVVRVESAHDLAITTDTTTTEGVPPTTLEAIAASQSASTRPTGGSHSGSGSGSGAISTTTGPTVPTAAPPTTAGTGSAAATSSSSPDHSSTSTDDSRPTTAPDTTAGPADTAVEESTTTVSANAAGSVPADTSNRGGGSGNGSGSGGKGGGNGG